VGLNIDYKEVPQFKIEISSSKLKDHWRQGIRNPALALETKFKIIKSPEDKYGYKSWY